MCMYRDGHTLRGHFSIGTIGPRESVLCSQRSSDVIRVQSLWECVKYRDKGKNKRGPRRVWSFTNVCTCLTHRSVYAFFSFSLNRIRVNLGTKNVTYFNWVSMKWGKVNLIKA